LVSEPLKYDALAKDSCKQLELCPVRVVGFVQNDEWKPKPYKAKAGVEIAKAI
jgi:hypothetical protein